MNFNVGGQGGDVVENPGDGRVYFGRTGGAQSAGGCTKPSDLNKPSPARIFVILDEQADSINNANFLFYIYFTAGYERWYDLPGSYHNGAGSLSFADGHTEIHKWLNPTVNPTIYPITYGTTFPWHSVSGKSSDYEWVRDGMPYR